MLNEKENILSASKLRNLALRALTRRDYSFAELQQKLRRYCSNNVLIDQVLDELRQQGIVNDFRFVQNYVQARMNRGYGPLRISIELHERGFSDETIKAQLSLFVAEWHSLARQVREKRFGSKLPTEYQERARQFRFLQYRGFEFDQIKEALK